jgi:hypothetical protein
MVAKFLIALALPLAFCLAGCKKPETAPSVPQKPTPKPSQEFSDSATQAKYEAAWHRYFALFDPPRPGEHLLLKLRDGSFAGGSVKAYSDAGVVLLDGQTETNVERSSIAPESLADVFPEEFARREAIAELEQTQSAESFSDDFDLIGSFRYLISDNTIPRGGPSDRYNRLSSENVLRGALLQVKELKGLWVRVEPQGGGDSYWLPLFATRPAPNSPKENYTSLIDRIQTLGILAGYNPASNEAMIKRVVWIGLDPGVREGIARLLAAHATATRGGSAEWIEIKDAETGRRLARYSQAQGFRQL